MYGRGVYRVSARIARLVDDLSGQIDCHVAWGRFKVGITERPTARELAAAQGWSVDWMPPGLVRYPVGLAL